MGKCERMKKIIFLTGTRADFGKLKSLIEITNNSIDFEVHIFATGMHLSDIHGGTVREIEKCGYERIYKYKNHVQGDSMDQILANTIIGFSTFCKSIQPDLIVVHGDRVEAMSGAIVGALNNILVSHIEGGEISGTIDELIRHSVSKMSHIHFVANDSARKRLIQMGELNDSIFVIGSPDIDAMLSDKLPTIAQVKERYEIPFDSFAVSLFHPVTTEIESMEMYARNYVDALLQTDENYIVIYPNNDLGFELILNELSRLNDCKNVRIFPSIRFEYFIVLLKYATFLIGNSSAGIREAPYYGVPTINIGTRQNNRTKNEQIIHSGYQTSEILEAIQTSKSIKLEPIELFGDGKSNVMFYDIIQRPEFWKIEKQKQFNELLFS
jgi:UDP-N-acetylglucosamine 2-epimerase (hydrolysing)